MPKIPQYARAVKQSTRLFVENYAFRMRALTVLAVLRQAAFVLFCPCGRPLPKVSARRNRWGSRSPPPSPDYQSVKV